MSHHFLYHYNAYHIVITKPSLPRFYLYYIQKISAQFTRYLPKLPSITAKAARSLVPFPLPHPGNDKTIAQVLYLYYIQKLARNSLAISQNYRASEQPTRLRSAPKGAKIYPSELVGLIDVPVKHSRCVRSLAWQNGEQKERREKERP